MVIARKRTLAALALFACALLTSFGLRYTPW